MKKITPKARSRQQIAVLAFIAVMGAAVAAALTWWDALRPDPDPDTVVVYKRATCNCCTKWVTHLKAAGFNVQVHNESDLDARQDALGIPQPLRACHTATVEGYLVEGHVPAEDIRRLLAEKPHARGIAVPGMPIGSPGMEIGERRDPYLTLLFHRNPPHFTGLPKKKGSTENC
ncbi:MAG: DUF411 domain-containing protein [Nevskiales bacterium]